MIQVRSKLEWNEEYSVGVLEIDNQHKQLFTIINELIEIVGCHFNQDDVIKIIDSLIEYKKIHFATEERYFKEFNFSGAEEHILEHKKFETDLAKIREDNKDDLCCFVFALIEFMEDWLVSHLMTMDQKYKECFKSHGLK